MAAVGDEERAQELRFAFVDTQLVMMYPKICVPGLSVGGLGRRCARRIGWPDPTGVPAHVSPGKHAPVWSSQLTRREIEMGE